MTQTADESGQGLTSQATSKVQDAASTAQEKASELREQGSEQLRGQFDQRSSQAGAQVRSVAEALRRSGDDLRNQGNATGARVTGQAAERLEQLGGYLEQKSGNEFVQDVESFARRRPWMLAAVGVLTGVAAARFVKASSEQRYSDYRRTSPEWPARSSGSYFESDASDAPLARDPYASRS